MESPPAIAVGILILPLFDTLRVFITRMARGNSPFKPDRNHIHHLLLDLGYSHMQATAILIIVNIGFIFLVYKFQSYGSLMLLMCLLVVASLLVFVVQFFRTRRFANKDLNEIN
jgi:UDP-N-acetylmuramyl pentapeptide phosphotransferase/UDP-N-acetylglucosamine-1-phosphate transferase